jgi:hypothetical protein
LFFVKKYSLEIESFIFGGIMKKLLGIVSMLLVFGGPAQADVLGPDLICTGDNGEALTVNLFQTRTETVFVNAILKEDNLSQNLTGSTKRGLTEYQMDDLNGEKVSLSIKRVFDHGGRCGRCSPSINIETYAKLIIGPEVKTFNCNL